MILPLIIPDHALTAAATRELATREQLWPVQVQANRATEAEADADLAAWRAILHWTRGDRFNPLERDRTLPLLAVLEAAQERRWAAMVPDTDDRHPARLQRLLDTRALTHALDRYAIRVGWTAAQASLAKAA